jgi:isopentenyl phosphate kinase
MTISSTNLIYLKLGGSLITNKNQQCTPILTTIRRLALEISRFYNRNPRTSILIGHGAGSYGHIQAIRHNILQSAHHPIKWPGVLEVANAISQLNRIVNEELLNVGLKTSVHHPSATAICHNGNIRTLDIDDIKHSVDSNIIPITHGDICFDDVRGASIVSTESIFAYLSQSLTPTNIYIAGVEEGVYTTFPAGHVIPSISHSSDKTIFDGITNSRSPDVTGGMRTKVNKMLELTYQKPEVKIHIFSALQPNSLIETLNGVSTKGTIISSNLISS